MRRLKWKLWRGVICLFDRQKLLFFGLLPAAAAGFLISTGIYFNHETAKEINQLEIEDKVHLLDSTQAILQCGQELANLTWTAAGSDRERLMAALQAGGCKLGLNPRRRLPAHTL